MPVSAAFFTNGIWGSAKIRGAQLAERLGVPCDKQFLPADMPRHVVCVKAIPNDLAKLALATNVWIDPVDSDSSLPIVVAHPTIKLLAISETAKHYMEARVWNKIFLAPEHHCNFENETKSGMQHNKTVGFVGYAENFQLSFNKLEHELGQKQLAFETLLISNETTREDIVAFYRKIDIQVTFRGPRLLDHMPPEMKNPLKVINAASFGIPTVGYPEPSYVEFPVRHEARTFDELVYYCIRVAEQPPIYRSDLIERASEYHIDNVVKIYEELLS